MSLNYIRKATITVGGSTWTIEPPPANSLRLRIAVRQFTDGSVNLGTVRITNPNPQKAIPLKQWDGQQMVIKAGYNDNEGIIFQGQVKQAIYGRENPTDTMLSLFAGDNDRNHNYAVVNKTFAPGSKPLDHVNAVLQAMQIDPLRFGGLGRSLNLMTPIFPRAVTLFGLARDVLFNIAKSKQAHASVQNGQLQIMGKDDVMTSNAIVLDTNTGLIGMPTQTLHGIMARVLINPTIKINTLVKIDESLIQKAELAISGGNETGQATAITPQTSGDGIYKVLQVDVDGDSRADTPWYMDLTCLAAPGGQVPQGAYIPPGIAGAAGGPPITPQPHAGI